MIQRVYRLRATWPDGRVAWYERKGWPPHWGELETSSLWPTEHGPRSAVGQLKKYYRRYEKRPELIPEMKIIPFGLVGDRTFGLVETAK